MKLLILRGLPASGKTTWAKEFVSKNKDWVRINRDDLRNMRGEYWIPKQEGLITVWEDTMVVSALARGLNVVLDATNLHKGRIDRRIKSFGEVVGEFNVEYRDFNTSVEECIERDSKRENSVGEGVIRKMAEKYGMLPPRVEYIEDESLPRAIIVDVDGTVAEMHNRTPFEWDKVSQDLPKKNIIDIVKRYSETHSIIFLSGRDEKCIDETAKWLFENATKDFRGLASSSYLHMRPEGDARKDSVVKRELFENNVRGKYYVDFVLDDRDQVVDMWRKEIGLTCLQVGYGNF